MDDPTAAALSPRPPDCNAALVLADGTVFWGQRHRGAGPGGRRSLLQHRDHRLSGNPDRSRLMPGRSSPLPFPISAMSAPIPRTSRRRHRPPAASSSANAITEPANYRAEQSLDSWLKSHGVVGLSGVDTRRLTRLIRDRGAPNGVIAYRPGRQARHRRDAGGGDGLAGARRHGPRPRGQLPPEL